MDVDLITDPHQVRTELAAAEGLAARLRTRLAQLQAVEEWKATQRKRGRVGISLHRRTPMTESKAHGAGGAGEEQR